MIRILFFFLFTSIVYSQKNDFKYLGEPYYPEQFLSKKDSLKWPIIFDISIDIKDIKGLIENKDESENQRQMIDPTARRPE